MNVLGQYLEDREDRGRQLAEGEVRWLREGAGVDAEERLKQWDSWLMGTLAKSLQWPGDEDARWRLIRQCAAEITVLARQLRGRGWLLDGKALAGHVQDLLAPVAEAQRAGKIGDFWPYFRAVVARYVGNHSDEIAAHARRTGVEEGAQTLGAVLSGLAVVREASLTELLAGRGREIGAAKAETAKQRYARLAREKAKAEGDAGQLGLFG